VNFLPWDWVNPLKWLEYVRGGSREEREERAETRETARFHQERRQIAVDRQRALRDNLRERVSNETDANENAKLGIQLRAADQTLTSLLKDLALDDPRVRYYFAEAMRELVPREVRPTLPLPEEARTTAVLVAEAAEAAGASPVTAEDYFLRGNAYYLARQYEEALAAYDRSLELRPEHPATLNNRGSVLSAMGRHQDALTDYNRSLKLRPDDPVALNNRGVSLGMLGRYKEALADFNQSLGLGLRQDDPSPLYNRACVFALQGKAAEALGDLRRAIVVDSKYREEARTDADFDRIRSHPGFRALMEGDEPPPQGPTR
jgi:tetratricopeptide (TPR) repeat protein